MSGIKGSAMESVVADLHRLVETGKLSRDELEARLTSEDLTHLGRKVVGALWYPLDVWGRLTQVLLDVEGHGEPAYLVERGRSAAGRLKASGVYAQLQGAREDWGERAGPLLATLGPAMYKDSKWAFHRGETPQHFRVVAEVPEGFPRIGIHPIQGFIDYIANDHSQLGVRMRARRESPTRLVFEASPR